MSTEMLLARLSDKIRLHQPTILVGDHGSGKIYLATQAAKQAGFLPISLDISLMDETSHLDLGKTFQEGREVPSKLLQQVLDPDTPALLILFSIEKASKEVLGLYLTGITSRSIGGFPLPEVATIFIALEHEDQLSPDLPEYAEVIRIPTP